MHSVTHLHCEFSAIMNLRPAAPASAAAARIWRASSMLCAIGFSSITCLPAAKHCLVTGKWRWCGSMMSTAAKLPSASAVSTDVKTAAEPPAAATLSASSCARAADVSTQAVTPAQPLR